MSRSIYRAIQSSARQQELLARRLATAARQQALAAKRAQHAATLDYQSAREALAQAQTEDLASRVSELESILVTSLPLSGPFDFAKLKTTAPKRQFTPGDLAVPKARPDTTSYDVAPLGVIAGLFKSQVRRHDDAVESARLQLEADVRAWDQGETERKKRLNAARADFDGHCEAEKAKVDAFNAEIDGLATKYEALDPDAVKQYFELVLDDAPLPDGLPAANRIAYVAESRQLVVERQLPNMADMPAVSSYRYVKKTDKLEPVHRKTTELRELYNDVLSQIACLTLNAVTRADSGRSFDVVVLNCYLDTIDPASGNPVRPTIISVRATKEALSAIAFKNVDAAACLKSLRALVSRNAQELEAVRPIVSFDMVDRRFVDKGDVLAELDSRPNLAELSPTEFETLMTNLFEKMGLETRQTQASRDGGVDCVAWDMRPVIGGKVVIQAKRYRNTVGVSAVRDLYGPVMNEGASKGILVTTSGYGPTAYEFAKNKPLELLTGSNLLAMLEDVGVQAKIEFPLEWHDPVADSESVGSEPVA